MAGATGFEDGRYWVFLVFGQREIILKHTTPRNLATAGRKSGTVIQALRHLGQRHVDVWNHLFALSFHSV
jgi:hypothetical protein